MDEFDAKDMSGEALQMFLDEGNTEKIVEIVNQLHHRFGTPEPVSSPKFGLVFGGFVVGAGLGAVGGYIFAQRRLETKYSELAAEEIAEMQEHYHEKALALENEASKGDLEAIVKERGYSPDPEESAAPPMAVTPPAAVTDRAAEIAESEDEAAGEPPDDEPIDEAPEVVTRNVFRDHGPPEDEWDWHKEKSRRSPLRPYVIHRDEREDEGAYDAVTYTYYEADDVVCNERDEALSEPERERIVGEDNLSKFGHGSGDATTVWVRNNELEMDIEVCLSPNSYAEEVHGLQPEIKHSHRRRERNTFEDE